VVRYRYAVRGEVGCGVQAMFAVAERHPSGKRTGSMISLCRTS